MMKRRGRCEEEETEKEKEGGGGAEQSRAEQDAIHLIIALQALCHGEMYDITHIRLVDTHPVRYCRTYYLYVTENVSAVQRKGRDQDGREQNRTERNVI